MGELETEDEAGQIVFYTNIVSREAFITQDNPQGYCMAEADDDIYND